MFCRPIQQAPILWLAFASLAATLAAAEVKSTESVEPFYHATRWTAEDGLPQMRISALAQTPDGYLWAGTWFGLARFDGVRFVVFNSANTPELKKESITALAVDRGDGALWIGTQAGLVRFKDRQFTRPAEAHELSASIIVDLVPAAGGGVWVWTHEAVVLWQDRLSAWVPLYLTPPEGRHSAWETEEGHLVVATDRRCLEVAEDGTMSEWRLPGDAPPHQWMAGVRAKDHARQVWLGTLHGLFRFADGQWQELQTFALRREPCDRFLPDRAGCVWAACAQVGLFRCAGSGAQPIPLGDRGAEKSINCLLQDREGYVWVGTDAGLYQLRPRLMRAYSVAEGLPHRECWSVCEAPDGAIWVGTIRGVARIKDGHAQTVPGEPRSAGSLTLVDRDNTVWLGDYDNGIIAWRPGSETNRFWSNLPPNPGTRVPLEAIYQSPSGRLWVGTGRGATWFENGQPAARWGECGLPTNSVRSIYQTRDGTMWFGTWQAGAVRWNEKSLTRPSAPLSHRMGEGRGEGQPTRYTSAEGLADDRVFVFHEDADGALWIGTHNGLSRFKDGRFFTFRAEQGLFDNLINWLEEDDAGRLWFSCNRGIFRMGRAELNAVADGRKPRATAIVYGVADGMLTPETNGEHQPAGCKGRDGRLWFPTTDGVVVIDPRAIQNGDLPPPVVIEQVVADKEVIFGDGVAADVRRLSTQIQNPKSEIRNSQSFLTSAATRLGPGRARVLQFRYTASSFADPKRARFRYRLAPHDADWREETTERIAYYTDLRPDNYRFEVKAASARGAWNETPAVFAFSLAPKFTQTAWFPASLIVGGLLLAAAFLNWRLRWQRRLLRLQHQQALADERTRIARDLHDDLGTALTGVALELDVVRRDSHDGPALGNRLAESATRIRRLAERMREVVWAVNPRCDTVSSLASFLEQQAGQFLKADGLRCRLEFPEDIPALPLDGETRHHLALGVREALSNALRHAAAGEVVLSLGIEADQLIVRVADNGRGFRVEEGQACGRGLANLRARLEKMGGRCAFRSAPGAGTTIEMRVPLDRVARQRTAHP